MYAIYGNIYHQYTPNVSIYIYTIHGSYGICINEMYYVGPATSGSVPRVSHASFEANSVKVLVVLNRLVDNAFLTSMVPIVRHRFFWRQIGLIRVEKEIQLSPYHSCGWIWPLGIQCSYGKNTFFENSKSSWIIYHRTKWAVYSIAMLINQRVQLHLSMILPLLLLSFHASPLLTMLTTYHHKQTIDS